MAEALSPHLSWLLWCVPLLPLLAGGVIAFLPDRFRKAASGLALGALFISCLISIGALICALAPREVGDPLVATSHSWFTFGDITLKVGLLLDPMSAAMAAMVTFVAFWIFLYSTGYMAAENCNIKPGDTVLVFGCGPVGQFAIRSAFLLGAGRVIAVDSVTCRAISLIEADSSSPADATVWTFIDAAWAAWATEVD